MTQEDNKIVLVDDEGKELEFEVVDILEVDEDQYVILLPVEEADKEAAEAIILKVGLDDEGEEILFEIEDDDEWEMVANAWQDMMQAGPDN